MRKNKTIRRKPIEPDPRFNDPMVTRFVNNLMLHGKKNSAFLTFYKSMEIVEQRMKESELSPLEIWKKALENVTPMVEVKSRRIGGATFQVPMEVRPERKIAISMKNLIKFARTRAGKSMAERLAAEIMAAYNQEGGAFKKKEDMHRMAEANKAFAHFRF